MESSLVKSKTAKRASVACTACRQVKLRCDAKATFPQPCSRCKTTSRTCEIDSSFKRIATRNQLEKVTRELANLQRHLSSPKELGSAIPTSGGSVAPRNGSHVELEQQPLLSYPSQNPENELDCEFEPENAFGTNGIPSMETDYALSGLEITHEEVLQLFDFFARRMYHHLPILDTTIKFERIYRDAPLLFWAIIITSSQHHPRFAHLTALLRYPCEQLLGRSIITAPMQFHVMQAVLLLCYWPLPCARQTADPSWNLWGLIDNAARSQRLNIQATEPSAPIRRSVWARFWLASFTVGVSLAMFAGIQPPVHSPSDLGYIRNLLETTRLPPHLAIMTEIDLCAVKYATLFSPGPHHNLQNSTIQLFDAELDLIRQRYTTSWNTESTIALQRSRLGMLSAACIAISAVTTSCDSLYRHKNVELFKSSGLQASAKLLTAFSDLVEEAMTCAEPSTPTQDDSQIRACIPKTYCQAAVYATFFLLKFCAFNEKLASQDRSLAERMIKLAYSVFMRLSKHPSDDPGRAATVVDLLGKNTKHTVRETNLQCASIIQDALQRADEVRGRPPGYQLRECKADDDSYVEVDGQDNCSFEQLEIPTMGDLEDLFSFAAFSDEVWQFNDLPSG